MSENQRATVTIKSFMDLSPPEQLEYFELLGDQLKKQGLVEDFSYSTTYATDTDMIKNNETAKHMQNTDQSTSGKKNKDGNRKTRILR